jgi:thiol-disulfide isomerase/thioredoxin
MKYISPLCLILLAYFSLVSHAALAKSDKKILHMPPSKITDFVVKTAGEKRIVMIYTSWCPICRKILPKVMDLEAVKPGSIIAISEDDDHVQFVQYIEKYKNIPFMIFLSKPTANNKLTEMFAQKLAVKPWDGYPHFILLDAENVIVGQGNFSAEQLADFILTEE